MALFNPRYAQLLQQKGLNTTSLGSTLMPTANPIARTLGQQNITPQPAIRPQGFGNQFKDTPPAFITDNEQKVDNKIERTKKPKPKKKKKTVKKNKK